MSSYRILRFICCIPVIVGIGYFIPFAGICLIITRYFVYNNRKHYSTSINLIIIGLLILIPQAIIKVLEIAKIKEVSIPHLDTIINSEIYPNLINYSRFLITTGIIFLMISIIFKNLLNKSSDFIRNFINVREQKDTDNRQKNDMEMKIKQEKAKNTQVVYCSRCGANNVLTETGGNCKYCRTPLKLNK